MKLLYIEGKGKMTKREKIVLSAYTGFLMCDPRDLHKYIEKLFGYAVFTHEMSTVEFQNKLTRLAKDDFFEVVEIKA